MVSEPAAGIRVERAKQCLQRVENADDQNNLRRRQNAVRQCLDVFGCETQPEFFTGAREHERNEQQRGIAPQRKEA